MKKYLTPDKRVWAVENFLLEKEIQEMEEHIEAADWATIPGWSNGVFANNTTKFSKIGLIKSRLHDLTDKKYNWRGQGIIMRIPVGHTMNEHVDDYNYEQDAQLYDYMSAVVYINDDFNGGELYYSNLNIEYKPSRGSIVFHPGFEELYKHGVKEVGGKPRYAMGFVGKSLTPKI